MQWFAFVLLISFGGCFAQKSATTGKKTVNDTGVPISNNVLSTTGISTTSIPTTETNNSKKSVNNDDPEINGVTVPDAPVTEINSPIPTTFITTVKPPTISPNSTITSNPSPPTTPTTISPMSTNGTTLKPTSVSPTAEPATPVPHHDRKFDGPSFVGGIILALGLVAIGFVAFKFYKARTEMNYHTL